MLFLQRLEHMDDEKHREQLEQVAGAGNNWKDREACLANCWEVKEYEEQVCNRVENSTRYSKCVTEVRESYSYCQEICYLRY